MTPSHSVRTVLTALRLWDGVAPLATDTLILEDGHIAAIVDSRTLSRADRRAAISLPGCTALPGLMDAHVHLVLDPNRKSPPGRKEVPDESAMAERAAAMVRAGITSARDLGGGSWREISLKQAIDRGEKAGPRLLCAGQPLTSPGGHCHFWGGEVGNLDAARQHMDRQRAAGVDLIKVMATGGRFTSGSTPLEPQFEPDLLRAMVEHARSLGLPTAAHCHGTPGIDAAIQAGVHSIEHCSWVGEAGWASDYRGALAAAMAERCIWVSPTIHAGWQRFIDNGSPTTTRMRHALTDMRERGVPLMASTDAGIPGVFHHQLADALVVFAAVADLEPDVVLRSATSEAARGLGIDRDTGRLSPGMSADVLVVDGRPDSDLTALKRPVAVWARGRCVRPPGSRPQSGS